MKAVHTQLIMKYQVRIYYQIAYFLKIQFLQIGNNTCLCPLKRKKKQYNNIARINFVFRLVPTMGMAPFEVLLAA